MPAEKDDAGTYTAFLRSRTAGLLLNSGGDALVRVENPPGTYTQLREFTLAETRSGDYDVMIYSGTDEDDDFLLYRITLVAGQSVAGDVASPATAVASGTAQSGSSIGITIGADSSAVTGFYRRSRITLISGTGAGQSRIINDYDGTTKFVTVYPMWLTSPDDTTGYQIDGDYAPVVNTDGEMATYRISENAISSVSVSDGAVTKIQVGLATSTALAAAQADLDIITGADGVKLLSGTQASIDEIKTNTNELQTNQGDWATATGFSTFDPTVDTVKVGEVNAAAVEDIFSTYTLVESYAAVNTIGTPAQLLYFIQQVFSEFTISGTTISIKALSGSDEIATFTMDDATTPTLRGRTT